MISILRTFMYWIDRRCEVVLEAQGQVTPSEIQGYAAVSGPNFTPRTTTFGAAYVDDRYPPSVTNALVGNVWIESAMIRSQVSPGSRSGVVRMKCCGMLNRNSE